MQDAFPSFASTRRGRHDFLSTLSQHARLLALDTPLGADTLLVERFSGREAMSGLFRFDIDSLAVSAHLELKALLGEEVTLRLLQADGGTRRLHGIVSAMRQCGSDGGLARYRLTVVPWMHALTLRRDSYVFQNKSVLDIVAELFLDYPQASYRIAVQASLPPRSITMQHRESDYDFFTRLMAEEGLNFFFEHQQDEQQASPAKHRLVIFDDNAALAACSQPSIRFHRAAATEASDAITLWSEQRQVHSNAVTLSSWDYKNLYATAAEDSAPVLGDAPVLEIHEGSGAYRYTDSAESTRIARSRAESLAMSHHHLHAESSARQLAVGSWFSLTEHASADGDYAVLSIEHQGANNLRTGLTEASPTEHGSYRNRFTCIARATQIRPPYWFPKPTAPGLQMALVVGIEGDEITTERDHRVKIQFPWQRGDRPATGQLPHPSDSNAPGNECAGTWVRVAEPAAGTNWGTHFIPRIGQEVLVDFIAGDIDRPVVVGQLYNGEDTPPFHGADNHPGALAGIKSKEYFGGGWNQWVIDDTPSQLRQSVSSTYEATQLNIGYLIRQQGNVRGAYRGLGFELATDAWASVRAKRGLFVTTAPRNNAVSTQLDTREAQDKLNFAAELAQTLADTASQHHALPLSTTAGLKQLTHTITPTETSDGHPAPAFEQPVALFDSEASVSMATPASTVLFAGQDMTMTASTDMRITGGQAVTIATGKAASLFTHSGGAKVFAAKEPVSVRAHTGPMDLIADKAITITSSNGEVRISAKEELLLASGGGYIRLKGSDIDIHCPATISVKGTLHDVLGAAGVAATLPTLPDARTIMDPADLDITHLYHDDEGLQQAPYEIQFADGSRKTGTTNAEGVIHLTNVPPGAARIRFKPDSRQYEVKAVADNPDYKPDLSESDIDALLHKHRGQA